MFFQRKIRFFKIIVAAIFLTPTATILLSCANNFLENKIENKNFGSSRVENFTRHAETFKKANAENVEGDFENKNSFEYAGVKTRMSKENGNFFARFERNGRTRKYKIAAVVGSKQLEEYVAESDGGELRRLPVGYDLRRKRWTNLNEAYFEADGEDFFRHQKNWQNDCAACHLSAQEVKLRITNYELRNHPASEKFSSDAPSDLSKFSELNSDAVLLACGKCHAKDLNDSTANSGADSASAVVSAHQKFAQNPPRFFADGEIRLSSHEYQGILRSVCYVKSKAGGDALSGEKINCLSCHSSSDGNFDVKNDVKLQTNRICTQCHQQFASDESLREHTKHLLDSAANCQSCHMPEIVYGNLRFQKTHQISVPEPALTITKNVPNACNSCHIDKSVNWAILKSKNLWTERFLDAKTSTDAQFDQPEGVRGLFAGDALTRAWSAENLAKHSGLNWAKPFLVSAFETEKYPLVRYFLAGSPAAGNETSPQSDFLKPNNLSDHSTKRIPAKVSEIIENLRRKRFSPDIKINE